MSPPHLTLFQGDSGGPISVPNTKGRHVLAGITSFGPAGEGEGCAVVII